MFSIADALTAGVSPQRLRCTDLMPTFRGMRQVTAFRDSATATPDTDEAISRWELARRDEHRRATAFATVMKPGMFFAGRTAAALQGAPIDPGPLLVVGVLSPGRASRHSGVRGVKVSAALADIRTHKGMRMTTPATTWAMLAAELTVRELVILGDFFVRVPRDDRGRLDPSRRLATTTELARTVGAGRRVGVAKLRQAIEMIRVGSASPLETEFRLDAASGGLPEPELDVEIRDARGRLLGISELVYAKQKVAVEIEGDHHRTDRAQWHRDIDKYAAYAAHGWEVVRLTSAHIRAGRPRAVEIVGAALRRRGWLPA